MLQAKYQKLKKKKKALQALKAPKQEPEKPVLPKRPTEARDAREIARKLIKSGAIQAIKSPPPQPQNATFKRPRAGKHGQHLLASFLLLQYVELLPCYIESLPHREKSDYLDLSTLIQQFNLK